MSEEEQVPDAVLNAVLAAPRLLEMVKGQVGLDIRTLPREAQRKVLERLPPAALAGLKSAVAQAAALGSEASLGAIASGAIDANALKEMLEDPPGRAKFKELLAHLEPGVDLDALPEADQLALARQVMTTALIANKQAPNPAAERLTAPDDAQAERLLDNDNARARVFEAANERGVDLETMSRPEQIAWIKTHIRFGPPEGAEAADEDGAPPADPRRILAFLASAPEPSDDALDEWLRHPGVRGDLKALLTAGGADFDLDGLSPEAQRSLFRGLQTRAKQAAAAGQESEPNGES